MFSLKKFPSLFFRLRTRLAGESTVEEKFAIPYPSEPGDSTQSGILIDDQRLSLVRYLRASKSGNLSWQAVMGGKLVKIYEVSSGKQAAFIREVSSLPELKSYFPEVIAAKGRYLIVEWVEGHGLSEYEVFKHPQWVDHIAKLQVILHNVRFPSDPEEEDFDYIRLLERRLYRYCGPISLSENLRKIVSIVHENMPKESVSLSHPDITIKNLVIDKHTGSLKLIDNEFLSFNSYFLIDLFNTFRSLRYSRGLTKRYLEAYRDFGGTLRPVVDNSTFYSAVWALRIIQTLFSAGKIERGFQLADEMFNGNFREHPLITIAEELLV